jgi:hypothetical protein
MTGRVSLAPRLRGRDELSSLLESRGEGLSPRVDCVNNRDSFPAGMILGGPDRAKISQTMTLKRIDYSLRMQRRV